ncbi:hypothetical protein [Cysteiniphilum sp. 6C5]|uniref:hypothetical protein n=1 Tax=unclassified Cysteiniphilum TaxID=2610889 RepID=UPI003F87803F
MSKQISKSNFKTHALECFRTIEKTGQPFIITNHGKPSLMVSLIKKKVPLDVLKDSVMKFEDPTKPVADNDWDLA